MFLARFVGIDFFCILENLFALIELSLPLIDPYKYEALKEPIKKYKDRRTNKYVF